MPEAPPSPIEAVPLTAKNLKRLPGSPPREEELDSTISTSTDCGANIFKAHELLEQHGLFLLPAGQLPPAVSEAVRKAMSVSFDEMRPPSAQKIIEDFAKNRGRNEFTHFFDFWRRMYKDISPKKDMDDVDKLVDSDWRAQGLDINLDQLFEETAVSQLTFEDPVDQKLIDGIKKLQRPKPDATFGVHKKVFTKHQAAANGLLQRWAGISTGIWQVFGLVEYKSDTRVLAVAIIQALRAASALVAAIRTMIEQAGMLDSKATGIDAINIIFSFCIHPEKAKLCVHWAEAADDAVNHTEYYMQEVRHYLPGTEDGLKALRQDMERVFDWGTLDRLEGVKVMLETFIHKPNKQARQKEGSSAGGASREKGKEKDVA